MSVIYQPRGRAGEYAKWACNIYRGCSHRCAYCYAPQVIKMDREEFHANPKVRKNFFSQLERSASKHSYLAGIAPVLLCFTSDPYQPLAGESFATRHTIQKMHDHDINVTILTKGGRRSEADFDILGPGDVYATTLTIWDYNWQDWEPNAASPSERIAALEEAKKLGLETWVSFEPVIRPSHTLTLLNDVGYLIDHCKVGPLNYASRLPDYLREQIPPDIDWAAFARLFQERCDRFNVPVYFKEDLRKLL